MKATGERSNTPTPLPNSPFSPPPSLGQAIMFCLYFETTHDEIHTAPRLPTEKNRKRLREITVALIFTCNINSKDFFIDFNLCVETLLLFRLIDHFITSIPFEICRLSHSYAQTNTKESIPCLKLSDALHRAVENRLCGRIF